MKNYVVDSYENYREEDRLSTNNARRIEFITTSRIIDSYIGENKTILDCAAGTGIYSFYFADKGHTVTAADLTPRHISVINEKLKDKPYHMKTAVADATDMSDFEDESFDIVLNMGPFYHLTEENDRRKCLSESLRVLKKGGLLFTAYIPRTFVFQYVALTDKKYLNEKLSCKLLETGVLKHDDENCFWTDTYYSSAEEMEQLYTQNCVEIIDHFAQDGMTPLFSEKVDQWSDDEFKIWCEHHFRICREKTLLGASNHVIIAGRKSR